MNNWDRAIKKIKQVSKEDISFQDKIWLFFQQNKHILPKGKQGEKGDRGNDGEIKTIVEEKIKELNEKDYKEIVKGVEALPENQRLDALKLKNLQYAVQTNQRNGGSGGGTKKHSGLSELDYASSGHTGFDPAGAGTSAVALHEVSYNHGLIATALQTETDPVFAASQAHNITSGDITNLSHLSGTNTGDNATNSQYSGLAGSKVDRSGDTMTGALTLATNSLTVFPIKFVAGPLLTVPVAGVMEFDGTDLYMTV